MVGLRGGDGEGVSRCFASLPKVRQVCLQQIYLPGGRQVEMTGGLGKTDGL